MAYSSELPAFVLWMPAPTGRERRPSGQFLRSLLSGECRSRSVERILCSPLEELLRFRGTPQFLERQSAVVPQIVVVRICLREIIDGRLEVPLQKIRESEQIVGELVLARILIRFDDLHEVLRLLACCRKIALASGESALPVVDGCLRVATGGLGMQIGGLLAKRCR